MEDELKIIKGVTQKGRNRVHEHGYLWRIIQIKADGEILLESVRTKYLKWLKPDFEIVVSDQK